MISCPSENKIKPHSNKFITLLVFFVLIVSGCGHSPEKSGQPNEEQERIGVSASEIILGSSSALTGHAGYLGRNYLVGARAYFDEINALGGVYGRMIRVVAYDDQYDPPKCVYNTQKLINEERAFSLFNYVGTPTSVKIIPLVEEAGIPLVGIFSGARPLRDPVRKNIFNVRASYYLETGNAVNHFVEDLGLQRIAVFYQNDAYGYDGLEGARISLQRHGLAPVKEAGYIRGTLEIESALAEIRASEAEAVIMVGTYSPCAKFIIEAKMQGYLPYFHNVSFVGPDQFLEELGEYGEGVIISQVVPFRSDLSASRYYEELLGKHYPGETPNFVGFEGFINAIVLVESLKKAGPDLTRKRFKAALEAVNDLDAGIGLKLSFSQSDHEALDHVFFTVIRNRNFKFIDDWKNEFGIFN